MWVAFCCMLACACCVVLRCAGVVEKAGRPVYSNIREHKPSDRWTVVGGGTCQRHAVRGQPQMPSNAYLD